MIKYHQTHSKTYTAEHTQKQSKTHNAWKDSFLLTYNLGLLMFDTVNKIKLYTIPVYPPPARPPPQPKTTYIWEKIIIKE